MRRPGTPDDAATARATEKVFGSHYRRYVHLADFIRRGEAAGLSPDYVIEGQGMAKFRSEDPWVARVFYRVRGTEE